MDGEKELEKGHPGFCAAIMKICSFDLENTKELSLASSQIYI
jgi:hypothetical protein